MRYSLDPQFKNYLECPRCHDTAMIYRYTDNGTRFYVCDVCKLEISHSDLVDPNYHTPDNGRVNGKYPDNREDN